MSGNGVEEITEEAARPRPSSRRRVPLSAPGRAALWRSWLTSLRPRRTTRAPVAANAASAADSPPPSEAPELVPVAGAEGLSWERLWLSTERRPWRSLALISVDAALDTPRAARDLAAVGGRHLGQEVACHDATAVPLDRVRKMTYTWLSGEGRVILAVGCVLASPAVLAIARAADVAILCVTLGESSIAAAARAVEEVGRDRFLGAALFPSLLPQPEEG